MDTTTTTTIETIETNDKYNIIITSDLEIGEVYWLMQENDEHIVLGILESKAQCGYANGGKSFRLYFNNHEIKTKYVKAWNYPFHKIINNK